MLTRIVQVMACSFGRRGRTLYLAPASTKRCKFSRSRSDMLNRNSDLPIDASWISNALIPRWLLFRRSFVTRSNLTPIIVHGTVDRGAGDPAFMGRKLFPDGLYWTDVDIEQPDAKPADVHFACDTDQRSFRDAFQVVNGVAWCPRGSAFAAFAGSDTLCLLASVPAIEGAFDSSVEALDNFVLEMVLQTLDEKELHRPEAFDDVWLRDFAWLRSFR